MFCESGGEITIDYSFQGADGALPLAGLFQDDIGLFGTTSDGGSNDAGTIFFTLAGSFDLDTLHEFSADEGVGPVAPLMRGDVAGQYGGILGTTSAGGPRGNGTIFPSTAADPARPSSRGPMASSTEAPPAARSVAAWSTG